jgi:hypothetical protein
MPLIASVGAMRCRSCAAFSRNHRGTLRRRQHLARHGAVDVPTLDVHHQEDGDTLAAGQRQLGTVDGGLVVQALEGFLWVCHAEMMAGGDGSFKVGEPSMARQPNSLPMVGAGQRDRP